MKFTILCVLKSINTFFKLLCISGVGNFYMAHQAPEEKIMWNEYSVPLLELWVQPATKINSFPTPGGKKVLDLVYILLFFPKFKNDE